MTKRGPGVGLVAVAFVLGCGSTKADPSREGASTGGAATGGASGGMDVGGSEACTTGTEGCPCHDNGTCNNELTCASNLCVVLPGPGGSGGTGTAGTGAIRSGGSAGTGVTASGGASGEPASCAPAPDDSGCVGTALSLAPSPVALYFMFDVSCSMSCSVDASGCCDQYSSPAGSRIVAVRDAMSRFVESGANVDLRVGLGFFGDHDVMTEANSPEVCSVAAHSDAAVEIGPLPGNAAAFVDGLYSVEPQGGTPTHLAISGACEHVDSWHAANPDARPVVVLVTDGIPETSCGATTSLAVNAAAQCFDGGVGTPTYVLGIETSSDAGASSLAQLGTIAKAGGTEQAYLTDPGDLVGSTLTALDAILATAAAPTRCTYSFDSSDVPTSANLLNVAVCTDQTSVIPRVASSAACGTAPGWYYDNPDTPTRLRLCDDPCTQVTAGSADLLFTAGCETVVR